MAKYLDYIGLQELVAKVKELFEPFEAVATTTDTVANVVEVPTSAKGLATLKRIGGMSYKSENLILSQKQIALGAGAEQWVDFYVNNLVVGQVYTLKNFTSTQSNEVWQNVTYGYANFTTNPHTFTATSSTLTFRVGNNTLSANINYESKVMLVNGQTAPTTYEPYYEGIRNSEVTKVESVGVNIWDEVWELGTYDNSTGLPTATTESIRTKNPIIIKPNTTYYCKGNNVRGWEYDSNDNVIGLLKNGDISNTTFTTSPNAHYLRFRQVATTYNHDICINKSNSAINGNYYPYVTDELAIPSGARVKYGVNENCYDYIEFLSNGKKYKHEVIDNNNLGDNTYTMGNRNNDNTGYIFYCSFSANATTENSLCAYLNKGNLTGGAGWESLKVNEYWLNGGYLAICYDSNSASDFKTAMNKKIMLFKADQETITDITDILTEQHLPIEAGGTLELVNPYNNAVPVQVTFDNGLIDVVLTNHEHDIEQQKDIEKLKVNKQDKLTAGSGITISGNTISADGVVKYKNILRLVDSSTGNPVFEFAKVGNTALYDEQTFEYLTKVNVLNYLENIGDTYNNCSYIVVGGEERDFVQVDKTGTTDLFEVVYQGLIGVKYDSGSSEITICFLDDNNNVVIDTANIGDDNSASYYFVGKSEEL